MRFAFFGTPRFAADVLDRLIQAGLEPLLVVTQPDAVSKRGRATWPSEVAERATEAALPLIKPDDLRDPDLREQLRSLDLDCVVLVAYGRIIPEALLDIPSHGWINAHASNLPRWRGAAPIQRAILAGDKETGVSIMRMEEGLDNGQYCVQASVPVAEKDLTQLENELSQLSADLLIAELPKIIAGDVLWWYQNDLYVTYADKIRKGELDLDPEQSPQTNIRRVRASSDGAPARFTLISEKGELQIRALEVEQAECYLWRPQALIGRDELVLACALGQGGFAVTRLQPAGKRPQSAAEFLRGYRPEGPLSWR